LIPWRNSGTSFPGVAIVIVGKPCSTTAANCFVRSRLPWRTEQGDIGIDENLRKGVGGNVLWKVTLSITPVPARVLHLPAVRLLFDAADDG
jgi:hypothetical protein